MKGKGKYWKYLCPHINKDDTKKKNTLY